jgi:hypothetical protein
MQRSAAADLIHAIRIVARCKTYLDPNLAGKLLVGPLGQPAQACSAPRGSLSDREEEELG